MLLFGILLLVLFLVGFIGVLVSYTSDETDKVGVGMTLAFILVTGVIISATELTKDNSTKHSLNKHTMSMEIKIDLKDGVEVGRDTIYVFTPIPEK